ncbi:energy transducer TonB [Marinifilum caeruleilacunae]|uniref:Energy transducer TonB n=1 Tax=Marinifilum caeruleilacunae TaxID=2499076 RepID=A0ABX1WUA0_9BACT|nr:energy transducer TonB [Marinifilum caeruleilacunae]NOU59498.1 energy transducer TonB [Marinifilum caeruleilacunae]
MKKIVILSLIILISNTGFTQDKTVKYYKSNWKEISKNKGKYYREIETVNDSTFLIEDYLRKGKKLISRGYYRLSDSLIEHGAMQYFDDAGNEIMKGHYDGGEQVGTWIVKNYHQVEYAELDYNFKLQYATDTVASHLNSEINESESELTTEKLPEFPGGQIALRNYLIDYTIFPYKCYLRGLKLEAVIQFTITKNGVVTNPVIAKSSGLVEFDKELIRMVKGMPQWQAGTQNGKAVDVQYYIPMSFSMQYGNVY